MGDRIDWSGTVNLLLSSKKKDGLPPLAPLRNAKSDLRWEVLGRLQSSVFFGFLSILLLGLLSACSSMGFSGSQESGADRFLDKITGAVWYQEFRNSHSRVPRIALTAAPGIKTKNLKMALKKHPTVLSLTNIRPDFTLHIREDSQAELLDPKNEVVWLSGTDGTVSAPPPARPVILWRGLFIGPRAGISEMSSNSSGGGNGGLTMSSSGPFVGVGMRMGYSFTNLGDLSAYMPQVNIDYLGNAPIVIPISSSGQTLSGGSAGMTDFSIDPLRFGWPIFSGSTLVSLAIGVGDVMLPTGSLTSSSINLEEHVALDIEYRLFNHWTPYLEIVGENMSIGSAQATFLAPPGPGGTVQLGSSQSFLIRAMVGIDWYPWISKSNVSGATSP